MSELTTIVANVGDLALWALGLFMGSKVIRDALSVLEKWTTKLNEEKPPQNP